MANIISEHHVLFVIHLGPVSGVSQAQAVTSSSGDMYFAYMYAVQYTM